MLAGFPGVLPTYNGHSKANGSQGIGHPASAFSTARSSQSMGLFRGGLDPLWGLELLLVKRGCSIPPKRHMVFPVCVVSFWEGG